jgi:hypothetical protein
MLKRQINSEILQNLTSISVTFILFHNTRMSFQLGTTTVSFPNKYLSNYTWVKNYKHVDYSFLAKGTIAETVPDSSYPFVWQQV